MRSPRFATRRAAVEGRGLRRLFASFRGSSAPFSGLLAGLVLLAGLAPVAHAGRSIDGFVGAPNAVNTAAVDGLGGRFFQPRDVGVVEASGDFYVVQNFHPRVQRFDSDGNFELGWGKDVVAPGAPGDTGTGFEICTVAADCKLAPQDGVQSSGEGEFSDSTGVAVNQVVGHPQEGHVYVRDTGNLRVQEFDADGQFVRAWGWGVATGGDAFEVCTTGCQQGLGGGGDGQLGATDSFGVSSLAVDPTTGNVYVADPANGRVQEFEGDGDFVSAFGTTSFETSNPGEFSFNEPQRVAVDSSGVVYATDSNDSGRVQRYDTTTDTFLGPIGAPPLLSGVTQGIEIDPATDNLLVARSPGFGSEMAVQELDTTTLTITDTHGVGDGFGLPDPFGGVGQVFGLSVDSTRGKLYIPNRFFRYPPGSGGNGTLYHGVFVLDGDGAVPPAPMAGAPLTVDEDSAELAGTVDPNGPSFYRFEYSKNGVDWKLVSGVDADPAVSGNAALLADRSLVGTSPQPVSASIGGLESNTVYRARIVTTKLTGPNSTVEVLSGEATFLTDAVPPTAVTTPVHSYTDTSAWLAGRVNPKGSSTSYRFEWGESTDYSNQAPASDANAGSGGTEKAVLEEIDGLEPNTTYHYRIVAESGEGATVGEDKTFTTRPAFGGFAERAFEQITPAVKHADAARPEMGHEILGPGGLGAEMAELPVAPDGDTATFEVVDSLPGAEEGGSSAGSNFQTYRAVRSSDGWSSQLVFHRPPAPKPPTATNTHLEAASRDVSRFVLTTTGALLEGVESRSLYLREPSTELLEHIAGFDPPPGSSDAPSFGGASSDLGHVFFGMPDGGVYEWAGGLTRTVSVDGAGVPFASPSAFNGVSDDGQHAFFSTPLGSDTTLIYRRSGGTSTVLASPSKRTVPDPEGPKGKLFEAISRDGDRVFFTSSELLTDDANTGPSREGADLYRYEVSTDTLVDVSAQAAHPDDARAFDVLGVSAGGDWVYYVSCTDFQDTECLSADLYGWHDDGSADGETRFLGTLAERDVASSGQLDVLKYSLLDGKPVRVSPDGRTMVFHSTASLTGYRNQGLSEVFIYEADANGGEGQLSCVSCRPNGAPAHGNSAVPRTRIRAGNDPARALSVDGRRVFFNSADALLSQDTNGEFDVYEWEAGRLRLLSSGKSEGPSVFIGASVTGDDVFLTTRDRFVGQDRDGFMDVYDARVGGGIAAQNPVELVPCAGEACKPALAGPPAFNGAGSGVFEGAGDYAAPFSVGRITARQRRLLARRGRVAIRVEVRQPGRILVRAVRGRTVLGSASKMASAAGPATVVLELKRAARRTLSRRGRLRLRVEVSFAGERQTASLDLRRVK